jgi:hypothetical protein
VCESHACYHDVIEVATTIFILEYMILLRSETCMRTSLETLFVLNEMHISHIKFVASCVACDLSLLSLLLCMHALSDVV